MTVLFSGKKIVLKTRRGQAETRNVDKLNTNFRQNVYFSGVQPAIVNNGQKQDHTCTCDFVGTQQVFTINICAQAK